MYREDPRGARRLQPRRRAARARDPRARGAGRARGGAQPALGHAARPRRREHRLASICSTCPSCAGAASSAPSVSADRKQAAVRGGARARLGARALRERRRVRLQEPVPEPDPHLPARSARARAGRARRDAATPRSIGAERRALRARGRDPARRDRALHGAARRRQAARRPPRRPGDQDHDERAVRRARRRILPLLRSRDRERDHGLRSADPAAHARCVRGRGRARDLRRHRLGVRSARRARRRAAARRPSGCASACRRRSPHTCASTWGVSLASRARARVHLRAVLHAARAQRPVGQQEALCGLARRAQLEVVGLESVRRDWPAVARRLQRGLLERVFTDAAGRCRSSREIVEAVRRGELDAELVYAKRVRKGCARPLRRDAAAPRPGGAQGRRARRARVVRYVDDRARSRAGASRPAAAGRHRSPRTTSSACCARSPRRSSSSLGLYSEDALGEPRQLGLL